MQERFYPVTEPHLDEQDRRHLMDAFDSGWISSQGAYLEAFEELFAVFTGSRFALATCNGTTALHMALLALGTKPGDQVLVPTFTYVATANAVTYCGAEPVLVDCEEDTWNMDPARAEAALTDRTVGIIPVHLYGHPCDMDPLRDLAERHGLWILEDAAEAHGARYRDRNVGTLGDVAAFSLFGNKVITTGEGGIVTTDDERLAERMRRIRGQGMDPKRRYWFPEVGYNYRMTNLAAALGVSQLKKIDRLIAAHRQVAHWYLQELAEVPGLVMPVEREDVHSVFWLFSLRLRAAEDRPELRDELMWRLLEDGIDTRPFFHPMHTMPVYDQDGDFRVADRIARSGLSLPSSPRLDHDDVRHIAGRLIHHAEALGALPRPAGL